jgi:hypothetical protein
MHAAPALHLPTRRPLPPWAWTVAGGAGLALADLAFAAAFWALRSGTPPIRIPQSIAAWVLGSEVAHLGGVATALAGTLLYACLVCAMVAGYAYLSRHAAVVRTAGIAGGVLYGCGLYLVLFRLVLPAWSAAPPDPSPPAWALACIVAYAGIGAGCAWIARHVDRLHADGARAG